MMIFASRQTPLASTSESALRQQYINAVVIAVFLMAGLIVAVFESFDMTVGLFVNAAVSLVIAFGMTAAGAYLLKRPQSFRLYLRPVSFAMLFSLIAPHQLPLWAVGVSIVSILALDKLLTFFHGAAVLNPLLFVYVVIYLVFSSTIPMDATVMNLYRDASLASLSGLFTAVADMVLLGLFILAAIYLAVGRVNDTRMLVSGFLHMLLGVAIFGFFTSFSLTAGLVSGTLGFAPLTFVFLLAEPTSTPTTREMKTVYAFIAGILIAFFAVFSNVSQGPLFAVLYAQATTWLISRFQTRTSRLGLRMTHIVIAFLWLSILVAFILN